MKFHRFLCPILVDSFHFHEMSDSFDHTPNLRCVNMYNGSAYFAQSESYYSSLLRLDTFYRALYLCDFQLTHINNSVMTDRGSSAPVHECTGFADR